MKNKIKTILIIIPIATILFFGIDIGNGCACIERGDAIKIEMARVKSIVEKYKETKGIYPTYNELKQTLNGLKEYEEKKSTSEGIYYSTSVNGSEYTLKGYMGVEFYGMKLPLILEVKKLTDL